MAKRKVARKIHHRGIAARIPAKHHDRVIVYGGILAIILILILSNMH